MKMRRESGVRSWSRASWRSRMTASTSESGTGAGLKGVAIVKVVEVARGRGRKSKMTRDME